MCNFFKDHKGKIAIAVFVIVYAGFMAWIQSTGQDWKYWNPIIHGGWMTLGGAGIGAWIGTLKTKDAAIKAAKVAGRETRKAMRKQVEVQARIAEEKEQMALAQEVSVYIRNFCSGVNKLMECWDGSKPCGIIVTSIGRCTFQVAS